MHLIQKTTIFVGTVLILALTLGLADFAITRDYSLVSSASPSPTEPGTVFPPGPAIYYTTQTGFITSEATYIRDSSLYRSSFSGQKNLITTFHTSDPDFIVSPDENVLMAKNERSIIRINPHTGKQTIVYEAQYPEVAPLLLSPDKTQVLIWESKENDDLTRIYRATIYDSKSEKLTFLGSGSIERNLRFDPVAWLQKDVILFSETTYNDGFQGWYYNPSTNNLTPSHINLTPFSQVTSHLAFVKPNDETHALTNLFCSPSEVAPSSYTYTTETGTVSSFGVANKQVQIEAFSPDESEVLLAVFDQPSNQSDCRSQYPASTQFFTSNLDGQNLKPVSDYRQLLESWGAPQPVHLTSTSSANGEEVQYNFVLGTNHLFSLNFTNYFTGTTVKLVGTVSEK